MSAPPTVITTPTVPVPNATIFEPIARKAQETVSFVLFTVLHWDAEQGLLRRIYSSEPTKYPVGGSKRMLSDAPWPRAVLYAKEPHSCLSIADIQATFSDWQSIVNLGCHSQISIPLIDDQGVVLGALNFSGGEGVYTKETVKVLAGFAEEGVGAIKVWKQENAAVLE